MSENLNYGVILRRLRKLSKLDVQKFARKVERSVGWLSEVENGVGNSRLTETEFNRIVDLLDAGMHRKMFRTWAASFRKAERIDQTFDGAVLKFIRVKNQILLKDAASLIGISSPHLSKIERGLKPLTLEVRQRIMTAYGYNPASFKNLATDPVRSKAVPLSYKIQILIPKLKEDQIEKVYRFVLDLFGPDEI